MIMTAVTSSVVFSSESIRSGGVPSTELQVHCSLWQLQLSSIAGSDRFTCRMRVLNLYSGKVVLPKT